MRLPTRLRALTGSMADAIPGAEALFRTARNPGADLSRLPLGLDPRGISVIDGIRAALACALVILIEDAVGWPPLFYMALAANLTCFADAGGPLRPRITGLVAFTILGALLWCLFGVLRGTDLHLLIVALASLVIFCTSFGRVLGQPALAAGNVMTLALVLSLDQPLPLAEAPVVGAMFVAGGAWATLLALMLWRIDPYTPARAAVADVWRQMSVLTSDLRTLGRDGEVSGGEWDAHALAHRRAVRIAIEAARTSLGDLVRLRGGASPRSAQALLRLEAGEQLFGALIALSDLMEEEGCRRSRRAAGYRVARLLTPMLRALGRAMAADEAPSEAAVERTLARVEELTAADPPLKAVATVIVDRIRVVMRLFATDGLPAAEADVGRGRGSFRASVIQPIRANLTWDSAILRHATRTAVVAAPTIAITLAWQGSFAHWLAITVILTMQPFFAATWQRALERIAGTVLGGIIGAVLVHAATTPLQLAALMFPLCILGFSARQVSYGTFIACLMPQLVVLVELLRPGTSTWYIVEMRVLFSIAGGLIAVVGCLFLWPSWEHGRLRRELAAAIGTMGQYADAILSLALADGPPAPIDERRQRAGVALNNLEAAISRALQEPRQPAEVRRRLEGIMVVDATLRRLGGRLSVLQHDTAFHATLSADAWAAWRDWIRMAFGALSAGTLIDARPPEGERLEILARIARQIELLGGALAAMNGADRAPADVATVKAAG